MMTYEQADKILGHRAEKKIRYAEKLVRNMTGDRIFVTRHDHIVVTIHKEGDYTLTSAGWPTVTTKKTLNTYGPVQIHQDRFQWFATTPYGSQVAFRDGMLVSDLGVPYVNPETWDVVKLRKDS